jgi:hypothetical protein
LERSQTRKSEIYIPNLHPKQQQAFTTLANEYLFGGATRGGKSALTRFQYIIWAAAVPNLQLDIFRLFEDDVIANHMDGRYSFPELLAPWDRDGIVKINKTEVRWVETGSLISLEHCSSDDVMLKHQGIEKHVRTFEEATQIAERRIRWLRAWVTCQPEMQAKLPQYLGPVYPDIKPELLKQFFPKVIYTANPLGISAGYFRRAFVKIWPVGEIHRAPDDDGGFMRQYIPALVTDNPSEDAQAVARRVAGMGDAATAKAILEGDWDQLTGDFFREYQEFKDGKPYHCIPDFEPPAHWFKWRSFDWGFADPFAVYWLTTSDGEQFTDHKGRKRWYPRGAIIVYREWYGCDPSDPAKGLRMRNEDIAQGILSRTRETTCGITLTDSYPFIGTGGPTIADVFKREGVPLTLGDTKRIPGYQAIRSRLIGKEISALERLPMLYICEGCQYLRDYMPALQRSKNDPDDAVSDGEATHSTDALRVGCQLTPLIKDAPVQPIARPRDLSTLTPVTILKQLKQARQANGRLR